MRRCITINPEIIIAIIIIKGEMPVTTEDQNPLEQTRINQIQIIHQTIEGS